MVATRTFLGAAGNVRGSKFLFEHDRRRRTLVDWGLYQGERAWRRLNWQALPRISGIRNSCVSGGCASGCALPLGTIERAGVLHGKLVWNDSLSNWIAGLDPNNVAFMIVGLFVPVWAMAIAHWRLSSVRHRWATRASRDTLSLD